MGLAADRKTLSRILDVTLSEGAGLKNSATRWRSALLGGTAQIESLSSAKEQLKRINQGYTAAIDAYGAIALDDYAIEQIGTQVTADMIVTQSFMGTSYAEINLLIPVGGPNDNLMEYHYNGQGERTADVVDPADAGAAVDELTLLIDSID